MKNKGKNFELGYKYGYDFVNLEDIAERDGSVTYNFKYNFKFDIEDYCRENNIEFVKRFRPSDYFVGIMQRFMDDGRIVMFSIGDKEAYCKVKARPIKELDVVAGLAGTLSFEFGWNSCYERRDTIYFDEDDGDTFEFPLYEPELLFDTFEDIEQFEEYLNVYNVEWKYDDDAKSRLNVLHYVLGTFQAYYELGYVDNFWVEYNDCGTPKSVVGHLVF